MAALSDYLENELLDHLFGGSDYTPASDHYIGLFTAAPTDAGGGTEVSFAGTTDYVRATLANNLTNWPSTSSGAKANGAAFTFPTVGATAWGVITHFGIFDAATGGNLLAWAALTTSRTLATGDTSSFAIGALTVSLTSSGLALGDNSRNGLLNLAFGGAAYTRPTTLYAGAFTSPQTSPTGGGTEVTGGSYARVAVTNNATNFPAASAGSKSNGTTISWPAATASWGTVTDVALFDSVSGGNLIAFDTLTASRAISSGNTLRMTAGQLVLALD
jgi:hypothetical protein